MKLLFKLLFILLFVNKTTMSQKSNNLFENKIIHGYQLATGSQLTGNILTLNPILAGVGGTTWIFESPKKELIVLSFYWGVKPGEIPKVSRKYKVSDGKMTSLINLNVEYIYHPSKDNILENSWTQLKGSLDENIEINIKRKYPVTSIHNTEFLNLLDKYDVKIENKKH